MNNNKILLDTKGVPFIYPSFWLNPLEYKKIYSEINNVYEAQYKEKPLATHVSFGVDGRAYVYWFENRRFNDYNFYLRVLDEH